MCDNSTYQANETEKCHSIEEIQEYLKLILVETWSSYGALDFSKHVDGKAPIERTDKLIRTDSLEYTKTAVTNFKLNKH